jgi:hypothetical protein
MDFLERKETKMKRISVLTIAMLMVVTSVTKGYHPYRESSFWRYRVRWSVYTHSLVPGDLRYSPYAHKYGHSGLIPYWVRYSPYAFSHKHPSGLVNDRAGSMSTIYYCPNGNSYKGLGWATNNGGHGAYDCGNHDSNPDQTRDNYVEKIEARKERIRQLAQSRKRERATRENDGKKIIAAYLKSKKIDFRTNRILQIDNKIISADFMLNGRKIIIKYWNPVEILALEQQPEYNRKFYERYLKSWGDFCGKYQKSGGKIHQIITADTKEILAKLTLLHEQNGEKIYALSQTPP